MTAPTLPDDLDLPVRTPCRCGGTMGLHDWEERGRWVLVYYVCSGPGCDRRKGIQAGTETGKVVNVEWLS